MQDHLYTILIPVLPLVGFVLLGIFGRKRIRNSSGILSVILMFITTIIALYTAYQYFFEEGKTGNVFHSIVAFKVEWFRFILPLSNIGKEPLSINMSIVLNPISMMMIVVICFVSLMVHIFSLGYMKGDERFATYYAFLCLFTFSMLGLVLAGNIFQIYIFWELVGLSSYLLIGYYFDKPAAVAASKKAFIVTRFADLGFLIGILILSFNAQTLEIGLLIERLTTATEQFAAITSGTFLGISLLTWALTLVFIGGAGKSAMFPLHIWLPDAMEGPTPVSALIHAATMVVAGVFLVARLFPIFAMSDPVVLKIVMWVGAASAFIAAIIACTQTDIKRVLAYSTMSQIGYMMFALGVARYGGEGGAGYMASMFHLFTHAFFKSLLFLCAGAIIHLVHSNEMNEMGGLRKKMPVTHLAFLIACLAISGIPPFSGFFSKEEILLAAFNANKVLYGLGLGVSGLTAFYMFRLYFSIFWSKPFEAGNFHGEGTISMKIPLLLLTCATAGVGFLPFSHFVTADGKIIETTIHVGFSVFPVLLAIAGISLAGFFYQTASNRPQRFASAMNILYKASMRKFYIDEVYLFITKKIFFNLIGRPAAWIDTHIVNGFINLIATITEKISFWIKGFQSGRVQTYALYFFAGIAGLVVVFIYLLH